LVCPFEKCLKEFTKKCNMLDHLRTHTGTKPFACDRCDKSFKQRAQLYKHRTIHDLSDEEPFSFRESHIDDVIFYFKFKQYKHRLIMMM